MEENIYRSVYCGKVDRSYIGKEVRVCGWVNSIRNLGSLLFITLRDETGIVQLISEESDKFINLTKESTVTVSGTVRKRDDDMINKNMATGEIEIVINTLDILGLCENVLPFEISRSKESLEDTRLKYRYLDLRNESVHNNILFRSKVIDFIRETMKSMGFTEIQTPIITATSPEGARDFIVPSRKFKGKFYALPQAPQIFKQLLMVSGFDKYFQIAPCFRDEDPRSDRLYGEFYQLDFEMSFVTEEDVYKVGEKVFYNVFTNFSEKEVSKPPFRRIPYREAMLKYGSDKPDLRNPLIIEDLTNILSKSDFAPFKDTQIRGIKVSSIDKSNSWFKQMEEYVKSINGTLGYIKVVENNKFKSSLDKFLNDEIRNNLIEKLNLNEGDTVFILADKKVNKLAGNLRNKLGEELELIDKNKYEFCIVNDFPFFEEDEENGGITFSHNPFSMPQGGMDALLNKNPLDILAYQYDFVCNGYEMASGGVRNHDRDILKKAFELVGYSEDVVKSKFPALYEAFRYGAPPHAGMAPGIDRILMLLKDEENIREVVAFPLGANGADSMMGCPSEVFPKQLKDAHIKISD
ncbi:MAG: aspartate--tRNA ligase [Bacilli bacterium]|jgi:aspartyl-tRNA synthetase|nr:aspartate--tRNA ligase [Clostridium sp.]MDY3798024.1 aspartate--tRNA ligase [Bacilli bacterium]